MIFFFKPSHLFTATLSPSSPALTPLISRLNFNPAFYFSCPPFLLVLIPISWPLTWYKKKKKEKTRKVSRDVCIVIILLLLLRIHCGVKHAHATFYPLDYLLTVLFPRIIIKPCSRARHAVRSVLQDGFGSFGKGMRATSWSDVLVVRFINALMCFLFSFLFFLGPGRWTRLWVRAGCYIISTFILHFLSWLLSWAAPHCRGPNRTEPPWQPPA